MACILRGESAGVAESMSIRRPGFDLLTHLAAIRACLQPEPFVPALESL